MLHIFGSSYSFVFIWLLLAFPRDCRGKADLCLQSWQAGLRAQCALTLGLLAGGLLMRMHSQNNGITEVGEDP